MKNFADQDSSVAISVGELTAKKEIQEDEHAGRAATSIAAELLAVADAPGSSRRPKRGGHKAPPPESTTQFPIHVAKMVESIKGRVAAGREATRRAKSTIYQIPRLLRQVDKNWYEPQLISIGPYHRGEKHLEPMEELKIQQLRKILYRNKKVKLEDYTEELMKLEKRTKNCYSSQCVSQIASDEFVKMMLLDGCFLVEIFLQNKVEEGAPAPAIYQEMWLLDFISNDMLLLENQLPYFVLNCIYKLVMRGRKKADPMAKLVLDCFEFISVLPLNKAKPLRKSYLHLVHLFHHHCLPINASRDGHAQGTNDDDDDDRQRINGSDDGHGQGTNDDNDDDDDDDDDDGQGINGCDDGHGQGTNDPDDGRQGTDSSMDSSICRKLARLIKYNATSFFTCEPKKHLDQPLPSHAAPLPSPAAQVKNSETNNASTPKPGRFKARNRRHLKFAGIKFTRPVLLQKVVHRATSYFSSPREGKMTLSIPSAEELDEAGITFKVPKQKPDDSFLSIEFRKEDGVMEIPYLYFADGLQSVFLNLVAFELCSCSDDNALFVGYVLLMDCLISSGRDVKILRRSNVLEHGLGSDGELADAFNRMSRGVFWEPSCTPLAQLYKGINDYRGRRRYRWRAYCMHNYCNTPCATVSLLAAIFLLLLTTTQTYFTVFPRA